MFFSGTPLRLGAVLAGLSLLSCYGVSAEFYSSVHAMSTVFGFEQKMLQFMQKFIVDNERKLDFLRARLDEFERERDEARQWGVAYFDSPLNKYLLSKRLTLDWRHIANLMAATTGAKQLLRLQRLRQQDYMPDAHELEGAIDGLLRLQFIYRLRTQHVAAGVLDGVAYSTPLKAEHCLDIARQAERDDHLHLAHAWLLESHKRMSTEDKSKLQPLILRHLTQVRAKLSGNNGVNSTLQSEHSTLTEDHQLDQLLTESPENEHGPLPEDIEKLSEFELYRYTCNGHIKTTPAEERKLRCGYMTETHPFLLLAPLKAEELSHDPLLVLYHDVIYQSEIDTLAKLSNGNIRRATVIGNSTSFVSKARTSQFTFIPSTRHKVLRTIDRRVQDMTDLNMVYSEDHQMSNYGIGGHYSQHYDWFVKSTFENKQVSMPEMGNRIATVLFYLTDVEQGGGTAFPVIKQLLKPKKYAAAFWYNLHASGAGDLRTLHGGCPIIVGSKWVLNRWIRETVQSDRRPCHLWNDALFPLSQVEELVKSEGGNII